MRKEHVGERVRLTFHPECGSGGDVTPEAKQCGFTGVVNKRQSTADLPLAILPSPGGSKVAKSAAAVSPKVKVRGQFLQRSDPRPESPGEEIIPGPEPVMWSGRIADVQLFKGLGSAVTTVERQLCQCRLTEPAVCRGVEDVGGGGGGEMLGPGAEDGGPVLVDVWAEEEGVAGGGCHGPCEDGVDGEADEAGDVDGVVPRRGSGYDFVDEAEEVAMVADLGLEGGVFVVRWRERDFGEHLGDEDF